MILVSRISAASTSAGSVVNLGKDKSIPHGGAPALSVGNCHPAPFPSIGTRKGTDINVRIGCLNVRGIKVNQDYACNLLNNLDFLQFQNIGFIILICTS